MGSTTWKGENTVVPFKKWPTITSRANQAHHSDPLDIFLTAMLVMLVFLWLTVVASHKLLEIGICTIVAVATNEAVKQFADTVSYHLDIKKVNASKLKAQLWKLMVHILFTFLGLKTWRFTFNSSVIWDSARLPAIDTVIEHLYISQIAVWVVKTFEHRFSGHIGSDYRLLYVHHIMTIFLLVGSYYLGDPEVYHLGSQRIGGLILFLHDSSDIVASFVRVLYYLGLYHKSGKFLAEIFFVVNIGTWAYFRLYCFAKVALYSAWFESPRHPLRDTINIGLTSLYFMHLYWFYLFIKIAMKFFTCDGDPKKAAQSYEYESDNEGDTDKEDYTVMRPS